MLKSTHKPAVPTSQLPSLPEGWTEHKAPSGHTYYYNAETKVSTYTRPQQPPSPQTLNRSNNNAEFEPSGTHEHVNIQQNGFSRRYGHDVPPALSTTTGRSHQGQHQPRDRPKTKHSIPGCEPWVLVKTRLGRRFVYNPADNESFWRFPPDVMRRVVEYDRQEREKRQKLDHVRNGDQRIEGPSATDRPKLEQAEPNENDEGPLASDEEYEEVEVTDDEDGDEPSREPAANAENDQPVEFDEDDIAFQLQAMGQDYGLDPGEYGEDEDQQLEEGADGLPLTEEDAKALFRDMLVDHRISPYTTWNALIESGQIVEDDRYVVLPNMRTRKDVWADWSRAKMQEMKEQRAAEEKKDPKMPYFAFLQAHATPKLYWPEFRRKYQKEPEMRSNKLTDKDREKWYREYISRLKLPERTLKSDFVEAIKALPIHQLNRETSLDALPPKLLTDMRFISLRPQVRTPLLEAHLMTLGAALQQMDLSAGELESQAKEREERERRQKALSERQRRVEEEKRKQERDLRYGKGRLDEEAREVERAMKVDKQGLLGHMDVDDPKTQT